MCSYVFFSHCKTALWVWNEIVTFSQGSVSTLCRWHGHICHVFVKSFFLLTAVQKFQTSNNKKFTVTSFGSHCIHHIAEIYSLIYNCNKVVPNYAWPCNICHSLQVMANCRTIPSAFEACHHKIFYPSLIVIWSAVLTDWYSNASTRLHHLPVVQNVLCPSGAKTGRVHFPTDVTYMMPRRAPSLGWIQAFMVR